MNQITVFPAIAGLVAVAAELYIAMKNGRLKKNSWIVPALFSSFFSYSVTSGRSHRRLRGILARAHSKPLGKPNLV